MGYFNGNPVFFSPKIHVPEATLGIQNIVTVNGSVDSSWPSINVSNANFIEGIQYISVLLDADVQFDGRTWSGPYMCNMTYFDGTGWSDTRQLMGCQYYSGQYMLLEVDYNAENYACRYIRILNPPQPI